MNYEENDETIEETLALTRTLLVQMDICIAMLAVFDKHITRDMIKDISSSSIAQYQVILDETYYTFNITKKEMNQKLSIGHTIP